MAAPLFVVYLYVVYQPVRAALAEPQPGTSGQFGMPRAIISPALPCPNVGTRADLQFTAYDAAGR